MRFGRRYAVLLAFIAVTFVLPFGRAQADEVDNRIYQLNQILKAEGLPWTAGRTSMSDLSREERRALLGGPMEPVPVEFPTLDVSEEEAESPEPYPGGAPPVASFDWRNRSGINWMTPVTSQMCGDCWAHATCGSMEVRLRWQQGGPMDMSFPSISPSGMQ